MKKAVLILLFVIQIFSALTIRADEGMWLPLLIGRLNHVDMQKMGLHLTAEEIYSVNHSSIKDAIVQFGNGCSASIISDQGLLITNHHCGYSYIQSHSTLEHDYLANGFAAKSKGEEFTNEGLQVKFLVRMEDVTQRILKELTDNMSETDREKKIKDIATVIVKESKNGTQYTAVVKDFYNGNEFYLFVYETYKDVRLVYAPPSSIGKFGGETDNWMWPRETGDVCIFRIYSSPDGKPADYSPKNIPLKPKYVLPISTNGVKKDDFTMVLGYPGRTNRFMTSYGIKIEQDVSGPLKIKIRDKKMSIIKAEMLQSEEIRIKYSTKYAQINNYWKYYSGQTEQLKRWNIIDKKKIIEDKYSSWVYKDNNRKIQYGNALNEIKSEIEELAKYEKIRTYIVEALISGPECIMFSYKSYSLNRLLQSDDSKKDAIDSEINSIKPEIPEFFRDYNISIDKKLLTSMLMLYYNEVDKEYYPETLKMIDEKFKGSFEDFSNEVFKKSIFVDEIKMNSFLTNPNSKVLEKDLVFKLCSEVIGLYINVNSKISEIEKKINHGNRIYIKGLREMMPEVKFSPDANSTMRLSYGKVADYSVDSKIYNYFTTLDDLIAKENPKNNEFIVPSKLKELWQKKDYGNYAENGTVPVCFITNNDITGGSSGSPIINGNGQITGIVFDNNWESMKGDLDYDINLQRAICLDIRYILFLIEKMAGAKNLIDEMKIIKGAPEVKVINNQIASTSNTPVKKEVKPPILNLEPGSLKFSDNNGNNAIDANEQCKINFIVSNSGFGDGTGLKLKVTASGSTQGVIYSETKNIPIIKVGQKSIIEIPISSNINTSDGNISFTVRVDEPNGYGLDPSELTIPTRKFLSPMIEVSDYSITSNMSGQLVKKMPFDLQVLVQNTEHGLAEDVKVSLELPDNVTCVSDNLTSTFTTLTAGQTQSIVYTLIVSQNFDKLEIPLTVKLSEKHGKFSKNRSMSLTLNQVMASNKLELKYSGKDEPLTDISKASLSSDVDKNIPGNSQSNIHRYALIIGCEDYSSFQTGLSKEINVDFAANDALIFKQYCVNTLGVPNENIILLIDKNATASQIMRGLSKLMQFAKLENEKAELIFYYSGHGLPDEITKEAYIVPVDVSSSNLSNGLKLSSVYDSLNKYPSSRVSVFIDACFSGGARNKELVAMKGMRINPVENALKGNMVLFTSSSGNESSNVYREKQHGMMTYFLLKKLQETKGEINYYDLANYIRDQVLLQSTRQDKPQTPQLLFSSQLGENWKNWKFK